MALEDPFAEITARSVRFLLDHSEEIDSPRWRESLRREFYLLRPYQRCRCSTATPEPESVSGGRRDPSTVSPTSATRLDLVRAHAAMPNAWRAKTEVWLLLNGSTPEQVESMRRRGDFAHVHRSHVATCSEPAEPMVWRGSPWASIAAWLRGDHRRTQGPSQAAA
jgi:hypothetical protein